MAGELMAQDDNIVPFKPELIGSGVQLEPDQMLENGKGRFEEVVVLGNEGGKLVIISSVGVERALWIIEKAKADLLT